MAHSIHKAPLWKRLAAGVLDLILVCILAVGIAAGLSAALDYDSYSQTVETAYDAYEKQYGITFQITQEQYDAMSKDQQKQYDAAYQALIHDEQAMYAYNMMVNLMLLITTAGIFLGTMVIEFLFPLFLKDGQTPGKKMLGLCLVRIDGVRITTLQLFTRALLGKFTVETMIPVYIIMMIFWGSMDMTGTLVVIGLALAQLICIAVTANNSLLHDLMAGTVAADKATQKIFSSTEDLIEYQKKIAAEQAARQSY